MKFDNYHQYGISARSEEDLPFTHTGSCLLVCKKTKAYYYMSILSENNEQPNYIVWISWGKYTKTSPTTPTKIGDNEHWIKPQSLRKCLDTFARKCKEKLHDGYTVLHNNPHTYLPKEASTTSWTEKCIDTKTSLDHINKQWQTVSDNTIKHWAGRGLHICRSVLLWEYPYTANYQYTYHTLVRGIQLRFIQAFSGFEMVVIGWSQTPNANERPHSFTNLFYAEDLITDFKELIIQKNISFSITVTPLPNENEWLLDFINPNKNGRDVFRKYFFGPQKTQLDWENGISIATTFRNIIVHGALSPSQCIHNNFVRLLLELTELLLCCSAIILQDILDNPANISPSSKKPSKKRNNT